jgi:hypothetical protein
MNRRSNEEGNELTQRELIIGQYLEIFKKPTEDRETDIRNNKLSG